MPKLDIEKEHEAVKAIEDFLDDQMQDMSEFEFRNLWQVSKELVIWLKVRGYEVVKRGS